MTTRMCLYHAGCVDGWTAAWAVWRAWGEDALYIPVQYGQPPPNVTDAEVVIVDFSYDMDTMIGMHAIARSLLVLDHHESAQQELDGLIFAKFDMARSGAAMAWDHFHPKKIRRPWLVDYVQDRDLWQWKLHESKAINAWLGSVPRKSFALWSMLDEGGPAPALEAGRAVVTVTENYVGYMAKHARRISFGGYVVPIVNACGFWASELLDVLAQDKPFAISWFERGDGKYQFSLRSRGEHGVNVFEIAQQYGGGGHRQAAGFQRDEPLLGST